MSADSQPHSKGHLSFNYTCVYKPGCLTSHKWLHTSDCKVQEKQQRVTRCCLQHRRIARELVEKWSRPIFDQYREQNPDELRRQREDEFAKARQRRQRKEAKAASHVAPGML